MEYVGLLTGHPRPVIDLPGSLARLQASLLGLLPNPPMSPDNLRSLQVDSVTDGQRDFPGWRPQPLEAVVRPICRATSPDRADDELQAPGGPIVRHRINAMERFLMLKLVIGNRNYPSWSLRPWLALKQAGLPFEEIQIPCARPRPRRKSSNIRRPARCPA